MANFKKSNYAKKVWEFAKPYKWSFVALYLFLIVEIAIGKTLPILLGKLIDEVVYHRNLDSFLFITAIYGALFLGHLVNYVTYMSLWQHINNTYVLSIKKRLFNQVMRMKATNLGDMRSGDIISTINRDATEFLHIIQRNVFRYVNLGINYVISLVVIIMISYKAAILMLIITPLSIFISRRYQVKMRRYSKEARDRYGKYIGWVSEILRGHRDIRLLGCVRTVKGIFLRHNIGIIRKEIEESKVEFEARQAIDLVALISDVILYVFCAFMVVNKEITIGQFIILLEYFKDANSTLKSLVRRNMDLQKRMASVDRVINILETEREDTPFRNNTLKVEGGEVCFSNVSFSYDEDKQIIKNLDMKINAGENVAIVGESGSGKSTLAYLLLAFYELDEGFIMIDRQDINKYTTTTIRENIAMVQQEAVIFDGSIRDNLEIVNGNSTDEEIWNALRMACLEKFIRELPDGLNTKLGKDGTGLSGGQAQRLSIARVLLKDPKIIIFDEATSALDYDTEREFHEMIEVFTHKKTIITIAHRFNTIINSDRIIVLKDGKKISCGTYEELSENCEYFKALFMKNIIERREVYEKKNILA